MRRCVFWPEMNIFPYVSCVFWKTMLGVARGDQNLPTYLKFNEKSNEHSADFQQASASVLPVHFRSQRPPTQLFFTFLKSASKVRGTSEPFYVIQSSVSKIAFLCWWYLNIPTRKPNCIYAINNQITTSNISIPEVYQGQALFILNLLSLTVSFQTV